MKENIVLLGGKLRHSFLITPINTALCKTLPDDTIAKCVFQDFVYISIVLRFELAL